MKAGVLKLSLRTSTTWRSVWPSNVVRQQIEKAAEIGFVEFLVRRELPEQGAELAAQFGDAGVEKALDRIARLGEHAAIDRVARTFQGKHEAVRHLRPPICGRVFGVCVR